MSVVFILLHGQQGIRVGDPCGLCHLVIAAVRIGTVRECGVECGSRVEQLLQEGQVVVLLQRAEHAQVDGQEVVEGLLRDVQLGDVVAVVVGAYDGAVLHHAHRGTVVGRLRSSSEGDMMIMHESCALYAAVEVGVGSLVDVVEAEVRCCLAELLCVQHLLPLVNFLHADRAVVGYVERLVAAFLRSHLYHP